MPNTAVESTPHLQKPTMDSNQISLLIFSTLSHVWHVKGLHVLESLANHRGLQWLSFEGKKPSLISCRTCQIHRQVFVIQVMWLTLPHSLQGHALFLQLQLPPPSEDELYIIAEWLLSAVSDGLLCAAEALANKHCSSNSKTLQGICRFLNWKLSNIKQAQ